ncbi:MAG: hypothetical protein AAFN93_29315, partial [Bacteroidota bacterium]
MNITEEINKSLLGIVKRAEKQSIEQLVATFVDIGPLFKILSNIDHQILYGRRGTGKTHAFNYLANSIKEKGDIVVQIDMRTIGSTGGIINDTNLPVGERATRLLIDTLAEIQNGILRETFEHDYVDFMKIASKIEELEEKLSEVYVVGQTEHSEKVNKSKESKGGLRVNFPKLSFGGEHHKSSNKQTESTLKSTGTEHHRVHFGAISKILNEIIANFNHRKLWIFIDEWSEVPIDLQPILAELLRRCILPVFGITVKIAAIEQRTNFRVVTKRQQYIGIEVGADIPNSINLDEYMVFDNDQEKAKKFFQELLYKHVITSNLD